MQDKILTVPEIGKFFGVTKKTVYAWAKEGYLPAFKIGQEWMVRQSDLQKMITAKVGHGRKRDLFGGDR